jgi:hypothetical protein
LRLLCAEQGEEIQTLNEKSVQYDLASEKVESLEKEVQQNKLEIHKQLKEMELLKYNHNELAAKVTLQDEYIEKIHHVMDQQTRVIRALERQSKEFRLKTESFGSIPNLSSNEFPIHNQSVVHESISLENSLVMKNSPSERLSRPSPTSSPKPTLKSMESQTDFPNFNDPPFETQDLEAREAMPLESSLGSLDSPLSVSLQEMPMNDEDLQSTQSAFSPQLKQDRSPSISVSQHNSQPSHEVPPDMDPETSILTMPEEQLGSQLEDQADDRTESASQFMRNSAPIDMNSERSILNPTLHLPIHTNDQTFIAPPSSSTTTATPVAPPSAVVSSIPRPHSAAPSRTSSSAVHRYDVLLNRLNSLSDALENSQTTTAEELKLMKSKWNKKFHEMHDWILNYINQHHGDPGGSNLSPLLPSLIDQSNSYQQHQQPQHLSQSLDQLGTISLFQCPECYRLSKAALAQEGMSIPMKSSISHELGLSHSTTNQENKQNKTKRRSISKSTVDLPVTVNRSGERHKHRIDLRAASHSHSTPGLWWNMIPK